jgi:UDPglucose--hexose-1-phosphate uridylyltransferase
VLCFTPRHDLTLARMAVPAVRGVVDAWAEEVAALEAREGIAYVQLFENKGAMMGCSNPHPTARPGRPGTCRRCGARLATQRAWHGAHGRDLLGDYLEQELAAASAWSSRTRTGWRSSLLGRLALRDDAAPRRRAESLDALDPAERDALARRCTQ